MGTETLKEAITMVMMTENLATKIVMSNMMMKSIRYLSRDKQAPI